MAKTDTHTKKSAQNGQKAANAKNDSKSSQAQKGDTAEQSSEKKQRKQQAKQEAKLMLRLEEAQRDVQKAEQKLAKAQKSHEDALRQQYELEERLRQLRAPESSNGSTPSAGNTATTPVPYSDIVLALETPFIVQSFATVDTSLTDAATSDTDSIPADAPIETLPPSTEPDQLSAEGRTDVPDESQTQNAQAASNGQNEAPTEGSASSQAEDMQIESDGVSMPILTNDESAWPPPVIREEVAEAAQEEATSGTHQENPPSDTSSSEETPSDTREENTSSDASNSEETSSENTQPKSTTTRRRSHRTNSAS